jgi:hypothetical protein
MLRRIGSALAMPALLFVIVTLFYWKLTLSHEYSWMESPDYAYQVLPWYQFQAGEWRQGRIPLWDPYAWSGQSLIGQAQPGAAYPPNWVLFWMPLRNGWMRQVCLHWYFALIHYMAVLFGYWLCRDLRLSRAASALGGLAFGLGGWMGSTEWPQMLNGALWAPLVVLFLLRVVRGERPLPNAGLAGAALGMAFLSGHHQAPTFIALAAAGIWVYAFALHSWRRMAAALALFGALFLLVGAAQIVPAYEYGKLAVRWVGSAHDPVGWKDAVPYRVHSSFGLGPASVPGILTPGLGRHANPFFGVMAIALALIGAATRARDRNVRVLIGIACGGLLFSLCDYTVFHGLVYALVPMVEKARNSSFAILLFHFAAAVLAACGLDAALARAPEANRWLRRIAIGLALLAALLGLAFVAARLAGNTYYEEQERVMLLPFTALLTAALLTGVRTGRLSHRAAIAGIGLLAVSEFSMGGSTRGWRHRSTPDMLLQKLASHSDLAEFLRRQPGFPRVEVDGEAVPYTFGEWYGIDTFDAYTASMQANVYALQAESRARMLMGIRFRLGGKRSRPDQVEVMTGRSGMKLWANPAAGPRVWAVHDSLRVAEKDLPFAWSRPLEDLRAKPFLTTPQPTLESCAGDRVRLVEKYPNRIVVDAEMECRGLVVVADAFFPGWRASVDGAAVPITQVYGALRAVEAGRGRHRIEMVYRPWSVILGATGTLAGWLLATFLAFRLQPHR